MECADVSLERLTFPVTSKECADVSFERLTFPATRVQVDCITTDLGGLSSQRLSSSSKRRARIRRTHAAKCLEAQLGICQMLWKGHGTNGAADPGLGECPRAHTPNGSPLADSHSVPTTSPGADPIDLQIDQLAESAAADKIASFVQLENLFEEWVKIGNSKGLSLLQIARLEKLYDDLGGISIHKRLNSPQTDRAIYQCLPSVGTWLARAAPGNGTKGAADPGLGECLRAHTPNGSSLSVSQPVRAASPSADQIDLQIDQLAASTAAANIVPLMKLESLFEEWEILQFPKV